MVHKDNSDESGFDYLASKRDLFRSALSFDRFWNHEDIQVSFTVNTRYKLQYFPGQNPECRTRCRTFE